VNSKMLFKDQRENRSFLDSLVDVVIEFTFPTELRHADGGPVCDRAFWACGELIDRNIAASGIGSDSEKYRLTRTVDSEAMLEAGDEALRATIKMLQAAQHGRAAAATGKSYRIVSTAMCREMFEGLVGTGEAG